MLPTVKDITRPQGRSRRWVEFGAALYLVVVLATWAAIRFGGDDVAWATLLLFGPRWVVGLPLVALFPLAGWASSYRAAGLSLLAAVVVAGPVMGGVLSLAPLVRSDRPPQARLRVVTWNMGGVVPDDAFHEFLDRARPDVLVLQESDRTLSPALFPKGWTLTPWDDARRVATRLPIRTAGGLDSNRLGSWGGGVSRYVLDTPGGEVVIVNVHLPTVRPGVEAALKTGFRDLGPLQASIQSRARASLVAREWVGEPGPTLIVAGDFNTPAEGRVYDESWGAFRNAFSEAGNGWGLTKQTYWFGARIDHILYASPWYCGAAWVGPAMGSDHRPLVAELILDHE